MKANKTLNFILSVILLLAVLSWIFPSDGVSVFGQTLYFPSIEEVLVKDNPEMSVEDHLAEMERQMKIKEQDSIAQEYQDSLAFYTRFFQTYPGRFHLPEDKTDYFAELFTDLEQTAEDNRVVHILHYGDSQIEGDRITASIRQQMQNRFGGKGVGLLPAVQIIETPSVSQVSSENIVRYTVSGMHANKAEHRRYGAMGQVGLLNGSGSITINARNWKNTFDGVKDFTTIRLYTGKTTNFSATLALANTTMAPTETKTPNGLRILTWKMAEPIKKFTLRMNGSAEIYGLSVDGDHGVAVDNIPFRGSSGTFFSSIDSTSLAAMYKDLNVKLILMQFGGNTVPYTKTEKSIANYKNTMSKQIAYLKKVYPAAKIILIGPSDMSTKVNGKLQTYPYLEAFVNGMKEAALENNVAFWSLYDAMGGHNSMISWVKNSPSLAAPDYIHFNMRGANKIAELFFESLMVYYDHFTFERDHEAHNTNTTDEEI